MRISGLIIALFMLSTLICGKVTAQNDTLSKDPFTFGFLGYLSYQGTIDNGEYKNNVFRINRSYFTAKKNIFNWLSARLTLDSYQDSSTSSGNQTKGKLLIRIKYFYANFKFDDFLFLTKPNIEAGVAHTPWLDFEEAVNTNRMQGTMFMERIGLFGSADLGIGFFSNFGGEMDENYKKNVNSAYAGRYGSVAIGVYNGGGYSALEYNYQKPLEARLSIRPVPDVIPGLQISYFGAFGNGNLGQDTMPEWTTHAGVLSYESEPLVATAQYVTGKGNAGGTILTKNLTTYNGWSLFAMARFNRWRVIGRYDEFNPNSDVAGHANRRVIVGLGYNLGNNNILLLDFDKNFLQDKSANDINQVKLTMQVNI